MRRATRNERGATLVESAITMLLLLTMLFGIMEFGLAFRSWLTISHAAREGARAGAVFANDAAADIEALNNVEDAVGTGGLSVRSVRIYNADSGQGTLYVYTGSGCNWSPCPDPDSGGYSAPTWDPATRDVIAPFTDRLGVLITYDHDWVTGLIADTTELTTDVVFQLEPQVFE